MISERFFAPGPTEVRSEVMDAMQHPMIQHRSAAMELVMRTVHARLQPLFGTARPVYVVGGSATSAMEMAIRSGSVHRVLALVCGAFGERFAAIAENTGRDVTRVVADTGETVSAQQVRLALEHGDYDTVTVVHSETSTGALSDVAGIARAVREASTAMLLIDAVSSVGAMPVEMDAWGADLVLAASQKALALPPGLSFISVSERLLNRARVLPDRGVALDLVRHDQFWHKGQSPATPPIPLLYALDRQLADIELEGINVRFARHTAMARACTDWAESRDLADIGIEIMAREGERSPSVTCLMCDDAETLLRGLGERGYVVGCGYGPLQATSVRIGHMGDHTVQGLERLLDVMSTVFQETRERVNAQ
jgi:aspartate aminotransferase-like enzyme